MVQDERLLELVGSIYDCAIDPDRWTGTLNGVASYFNAAVAAIFTHDPTRNAVRFFHQWGTDPYYLKLFQDRYVAMDPFRTAAWFRDIDQPFSSFGIVPRTSTAPPVFTGNGPGLRAFTIWSSAGGQ